MRRIAVDIAVVGEVACYFGSMDFGEEFGVVAQYPDCLHAHYHVLEDLLG